MKTQQRSLVIYITPIPDPSGLTMLSTLAFGSDGTMWVDPVEMGVGPQHSAQLSKISGGKYLVPNPITGGVLINARVALEVFTDPDRRERWRKHVESMIQEHQQIQKLGRAEYESARNN